MSHARLDQHGADGANRIECRQWILEHHADPMAEERATRLGRCVLQRIAFQHDTSVQHAQVRRQQTGNCMCGERFA
jgi:hypothetical protein